MPWGAKSFLEGLLVWKRLDEISHRFFLSDSLTYTLRFEDLVLAPDEELKKLCHFLGEEFEDTMLDTSRTGKQVNSMNVPWKERASQPADASRVFAWRDELTRHQDQLAEAMLGDRLQFYGYPTQESFDLLGRFYPATHKVEQFEQALACVASTGVRFWNAHGHERPRVTIYFGDPSGDDWLGVNKFKKLADTLSIAWGIIKTPLANDRVYWIPEKSSEQWTGYCAAFLKQLLARHELDAAAGP